MNIRKGWVLLSFLYKKGSNCFMTSFIMKIEQFVDFPPPLPFPSPPLPLPSPSTGRSHCLTIMVHRVANNIWPVSYPPRYVNVP